MSKESQETSNYAYAANDVANLLPPQNIEAEEAILGGILIDPEAFSRVIDILRPEMFYVAAHQEIFRACTILFNQSRPTDMMSIATWLSDRDMLEKIGGQSKIVQLCDRTVSAINIDYYAQLVAEKFARRKLAEAGREVVNISYDTTVELPQALDLAEQKVFAVTQSRTQKGLTLAGDVLTQTFFELESRSNALGTDSMSLPGLATGFYDLDAMTNGLQRSDLIIIAGRPSMGKCLTADSEIVLADGSIASIAEIYHNHKQNQAKLLTLKNDWKFGFTEPSAFVDDGIKPVFRVTTKTGRSIESTIAHPFLTIGGWQRLEQLQSGQIIAVPRIIHVFGHETIDESEVKILVDRLGKHDRSTSLPEIIFKLDRSKLRLFLNRLFATNSSIQNSQVQLGFTSEKLARQIQHLLLRFGIIAELQPQDRHKSTWQLDITDTLSIKSLISEIGIFGKESALTEVEQTLESDLYQPSHNLIPIAEYANTYEGDRSITRDKLFALATALENQELQNLATSEIYWDEISSIEYVGDRQVYDLTIPDTHNFVANDICVHNTAFGLEVARKMADIHRLPVAIFSLEMSKEQLVYRLLASQSKVKPSDIGIDSNRLRSGQISENEWGMIAMAISTLSELPIYIDDSPNPTINELRSKARRLQAEKGGSLGLIMIDYLQLMEGSGSDNRVQELSRMTRSLKALARELSVPVVALSQLSRGVEARTNKRPMLSDLRESGSIEQDADLVINLYRDEYYNPDTPDRGISEIIIAKHRNGPVGTVKLLFEPRLTKFENMISSNSR